MKWMKSGIILLACAGAFAAEPPQRNLGSITAGSTIPQIAAGANDWATEFQILNLETIEQTFTLRFFGSDGNALSLPLMTPGGESLGSMTQFSGTLPPRGSIVVTTPTSGPLKQGYAVLEASRDRVVSVTAVITNLVNGEPNFRASVPGQRPFNHQLRLPFTNSRGFNTCIAFNSDYAFAQQPVQLVARDQNGGDLAFANFNLPASQHRAFCLREEMPKLEGHDGVIDVFANVGITLIAFTFDPGGRFWTQLPYVIEEVPHF